MRSPSRRNSSRPARARKIVVVGADKMSAIIDYTDRATCVLFGDGAGAVLIEPSANGTASSTR